MMRNTKAIGNEMERISRDVLKIDTLEARNSDSLDFHELPVWKIREALEAAYSAGCASRKGRR